MSTKATYSQELSDGRDSGAPLVGCANSQQRHWWAVLILNNAIGGLC
jgi:hypothetical protein